MYCRDQRSGSVNQLLDEALCDVKIALVLGKIAFLVRLIEQQPLRWCVAQCVFEGLKDQIAVLAAVAMRSQGRQCGRVRAL